MRQKCRRKLYKNNEDRSQAKGEASTLKTGKLRYQPFNPHSSVYVYEGLLGSLIFRRGRSRIFLGGVALVSCSTSLTNKPHSFFLQSTSCIRKPQVISGGRVRTPCTLPLDPLLFRPSSYFAEEILVSSCY